MKTLGVVTGLEAEARWIRRGRTMAGASILIAVAGASADRAAAAAARLVREGAAALMSFGLAGGLDPALAPGTLVVADAVVAPQGHRLPTDGEWARRVLAAAPAGAVPGAIIGSHQPVADTAAKAALARTSGAVAVDMESHAVAAVAAGAGMPFLALRAIADPAQRGLPPAALAALGPRGTIQPGPLLAALLRRPGDLTVLLRLGGDARRARRTLARAADLGPAFLAFG